MLCLSIMNEQTNKLMNASSVETRARWKSARHLKPLVAYIRAFLNSENFNYAERIIQMKYGENGAEHWERKQQLIIPDFRPLSLIQRRLNGRQFFPLALLLNALKNYDCLCFVRIGSYFSSSVYSVLRKALLCYHHLLQNYGFGFIIWGNIHANRANFNSDRFSERQKCSQANAAYNDNMDLVAHYKYISN